ncbi:MAG: hypothetical protein HFJ59_06010 [Clostridia bacterium]|nr:hypothetical protein [Clostridia bacterium]
MEKQLQNKLDIIKNTDTDDARFIINVFNSYNKRLENIKAEKKLSTIILKKDYKKLKSQIIDLDSLWAKPYFYTTTRLSLENIINTIDNTNINEILKKPSKFCKKLVLDIQKPNYIKNENEIDIVDFIKSLDYKKKNNQIENLDFIFVANKINEETLYKEQQLKKALDIILISDYKTRNEKIYDEVYNDLQKNFVSNHYCDFQNNKCVAQRHFTTYPINSKNGCCFTQIRSCPNLKNGQCMVECLACRLFSCPYLSKRGITYSAKDFILLKAFFTKKQRKHLVFDFYVSKDKVLESL